jgi:hypothetical protein
MLPKVLRDGNRYFLANLLILNGVPDGIRTRVTAVKAGPGGVLHGLHRWAKTCKSPVMTGCLEMLQLAPLCTRFHPLGTHLVTTASPEFQAFESTRVLRCYPPKWAH